MINRVQILLLSPNIASKRVAEKCGFKFEGIARGAFFHNGGNHDVEVYSILRDWIKGQVMAVETGLLGAAVRPSTASVPAPLPCKRIICKVAVPVLEEVVSSTKSLVTQASNAL